MCVDGTPASLLGGELTEATDGGADSAAVGGAQGVGTAGNGLGAGVATPDANGLSAEGELTAERAEVLSVLRDLNLLGALTGVSTIAGTVAAHDTHLDGSLGHLVGSLTLCYQSMIEWTSPEKKNVTCMSLEDTLIKKLSQSKSSAKRTTDFRLLMILLATALQCDIKHQQSK